MKKQKFYTTINEFKKSLNKAKKFNENVNYDSILSGLDFENIEGQKVIHIDDLSMALDDNDDFDEQLEELEELACSKGFIINSGMMEGGEIIYRNAPNEQWLDAVGGTE